MFRRRERASRGGAFIPTRGEGGLCDNAQVGVERECPLDKVRRIDTPSPPNIDTV